MVWTNSPDRSWRAARLRGQSSQWCSLGSVGYASLELPGYLGLATHHQAKLGMTATQEATQGCLLILCLI